jgi:glutathione reductase (NADPH)
VCSHIIHEHGSAWDPLAAAAADNLVKPDYSWVPSAVFSQPPLATVGYSEERAVEELDGELDVFVARFRPMKNILAGQSEKTLMKLIVHKGSDRVVGIHMCVASCAADVALVRQAAACLGAYVGTVQSTCGALQPMLWFP